MLSASGLSKPAVPLTLLLPYILNMSGQRPSSQLRLNCCPGAVGIEDITSWGGWLAWLEYKKSREQEQQERRAAIDNWVSTTSAGGPPLS